MTSLRDPIRDSSDSEFRTAQPDEHQINDIPRTTGAPDKGRGGSTCQRRFKSEAYGAIDE
jgi:hypothetical protein